MAKVIGFLGVILGLLCLSLMFSVHPAIIIGPTLIGFGLGFLLCG